MGTTGVVVLVVAIVAANAILWVALLAWLRGRLRRSDAELRALVQGDERFLVEPSVGNYRGATARFGKVKGTGVVALTDRRVLCAKAVGALIDVPLADVVDVREDKWFLRSYNGVPHVILRLRDGVELGLQVRDRARWIELLTAHAMRQRDRP
jgi:hypothetical protein